MDIDIRNYVDRWMNDYIVYHLDHLRGYGDADKAASYFNRKMQEELAKMQEQQIDVVISTIKSEGSQTTDLAQLAQQIASGEILEPIMDDIAAKLNEGIEKYYDSVGFDNYEAIVQEVSGFTTKNIAGQMDRFFELLTQSIQQATRIDKDLLGSLTGVLSTGKGFGGWRMQAKVKKVSHEDLAMVKQVVDLLADARKILGGKGDEAEFRRIISQIFQETIGDKVAKKLIANSIKTISDECDAVFDRAIQTSGGRLEWQHRRRASTSQGKSTLQGGSPAVDVFNQRAFILRSQDSGLGVDIELGTNLVAAWGAETDNNNNIRLVANTTLGEIFPEGTEDRYLAYNVIAHSGQLSEEYNTLRASVTASFFNEAMGSGSGIAGSKFNIDKAQYLLINGKIFSVSRIIRNICNKAMQDGAIGTLSGSVDNAWIGSFPSILAGMIRSRLINIAISQLTIGITLDNNVLMQYAY